METKVIVASLSTARVIEHVKHATAKSPSGVSFFSIRYYSNKQGEVSHYLINLGASYEKAKAKDIEFLTNLDITTKEWKSSLLDIAKAKTELINAFIAPSQTRSEAQIEAYERIVPGLKIHKETGTIVIDGYVRAKKTILAGEFKTVNSSPLTIAKNELRKLLRTGKIRQFNLDGYNELAANGSTLKLYFKPTAIII